MTSLEYYIEQIEQFISALTDDIESGEGTVVTQTKLAVYREVLEHLEEIEQEPCDVPDINVGDMISRQAVCEIISDIRDCISVEGYWAFLERLKKLPPVTPQPKMGKWIKSRDSYGNNHFTCPFCENDIATKYDGAWKDNYCSNCGARMQEVE